MIPIECTLTLKNDGGPGTSGATNLVYRDSLVDGDVEGSIDSDVLRRDTLLWLADRVARDATDGADRLLELLGRHLYESVFRGTIRERFANAFRYLEQNRGQCRLRLQLVFDAPAAGLGRLPWEFLYLPTGDGRGCFLAGEVDEFVLTRFVDRPPPQVRLLTPPIPVLLAACAGDLDAEEIRGVRKLLKQLEERGVVTLVELENPTPDDLGAAIDDPDEHRRPQILHVIGHGEPGAIIMRRSERAMRGELLAARKAEALHQPVPAVVREKAVAARTLGELFARHQPRLVFLQTCYSAAIDAAALYSTAQELVYANVPAVIAMQFEIEREPANDFAVCVYERLFAGVTIGAAVGAGRRKLATSRESAAWGTRDFGTPIVYLGDDFAVVEASSERAETERKAAGEPPAPRECPRCHGAYRYKACPTCMLNFYCACGLEYENPLGKICGACLARIEQPPYTPEGAPWTPPEASPPRSKPTALEALGKARAEGMTPPV